MLKKAVMEHLLLSSMASAVLFSFTLVGPNSGDVLTPSERAVIGSVFILVCAIGFLAGMDTLRFTRASKKWRSRAENRAHPGPKRIGHHPDCGRFEDHIIVTKGKIFCCGCLSLAIGSAIAIILMTLLMVFPKIAPTSGPYLFSSGLTLVALAFVETGVHFRRWAHILLNILVPIGFCEITVGVSVATGDMALGLIAVLISILLLDTRISISKWKHSEVCRRCDRECKAY
jgi:hypothetical protein